jgi:two-component system cell cycle response regulator
LENDLNTDLFVLQSHLESMLECVKQNSAILSRFQAFEMRLLNLVSLADMIDLVLEDARHYFDLDIVSLCLVDEKGEIAKFLVEEGYEYHSKNGLIFGLGVHPYVGAYKNTKCELFFSEFEKNLPVLRLHH